jgi:hypothetical protein
MILGSSSRIGRIEQPGRATQLPSHGGAAAALAVSVTCTQPAATRRQSFEGQRSTPSLTFLLSSGSHTASGAPAPAIALCPFLDRRPVATLYQMRSRRCDRRGGRRRFVSNPVSLQQAIYLRARGPQRPGDRAQVAAMLCEQLDQPRALAVAARRRRDGGSERSRGRRDTDGSGHGGPQILGGDDASSLSMHAA